MPHRSMMELIAEGHLEPLFPGHLAGMRAMRRPIAGRDAAVGRTGKSSIGSIQELAMLLRHLGVREDSAALECFAHVDGATARAVESIVDWMSYLPENCIKAMVCDGWHWST